tara:strand:+ start:8640 stop:9026 length:387 start_codon:yes stop_codon:yes gene_type:complete
VSKNTNNTSSKYVTSLSISSKNSELTSKKGTDVSIDQMITKNIISGNKIVFKDVEFTLDFKVKDAFNFYSKDGKLICNTPSEISLMSMPPDGKGATIHSKGDNFELSGISLIKINGINFVISDIKFNQ